MTIMGLEVDKVIGDGTIRNKDNGRAWITDRFPPVQPGGKNFSIDVTVLLRSGGRTKAMYDYREKQWKSTRNYGTIIRGATVKGWRE